jgi:ribonucleotide reductase beta subunit family protein with ferritin-like domain
MATIRRLFGTNVSPEQERDALRCINEIYKLRKSENGLTQKLLAERMGMKEQSAVSQYLSVNADLKLTHFGLKTPIQF